MDTLQRIKDVVRRYGSPKAVEAATADTRIAELLFDSLDQIEALMEVEDEFGMEIPDELSEGFRTLGQLVEFIEKTKADQGIE
jgi:acyl carrier protein